MIFEIILTTAVVLSGAMYFIDKLVLSKRDPQSSRSTHFMKRMAEYFPVLLMVLLIRSFAFQPFKVVSGSLEPTVDIGDYLLVSQYAYGLRLPITHTKIFTVATPQRGDIALFYYPVDPSKVYVKRVIGLPGDHIVYKNKQLTINGQQIKQQAVGSGWDIEPNSPPIPVSQYQEFLTSKPHNIYINKRVLDWQDVDVVVPEGQYFMMGDNRDDSEDSRAWGFVDDKQLIGKALRVIISWDSDAKSLRWGRIGTALT